MPIFKTGKLRLSECLSRVTQLALHVRDSTPDLHAAHSHALCLCLTEG